MGSVFSGATAFNQDLASWDLSAVWITSYMFSGATSFDQDLSSWDVSGVFDATAMLSGSGLSTENYDALLISWAAQNTQVGVDFGVGDVQYSAAAAEARALLISGSAWSITDGGQILGAGGAPP